MPFLGAEASHHLRFPLPTSTDARLELVRAPRTPGAALQIYGRVLGLER